MGFQNSLQKIALNVPTLRCEASKGLSHLHLGTSSILISAFFDTENITTQINVRNYTRRQRKKIKAHHFTSNMYNDGNSKIGENICEISMIPRSEF